MSTADAWLCEVALQLFLKSTQPTLDVSLVNPPLNASSPEATSPPSYQELHSELNLTADEKTLPHASTREFTVSKSVNSECSLVDMSHYEHTAHGYIKLSSKTSVKQIIALTSIPPKFEVLVDRKKMAYLLNLTDSGDNAAYGKEPYLHHFVLHEVEEAELELLIEMDRKTTNLENHNVPCPAVIHSRSTQTSCRKFTISVITYY